MPPDTPPHHERLVALAESYEFYPALHQQLQRTAAMIAELNMALPELQRSFAQPCPTCGAQAGDYCMSNTGKLHAWQYGIPYVHVARKPVAPVIPLRGIS